MLTSCWYVDIIMLPFWHPYVEMLTSDKSLPMLKPGAHARIQSAGICTTMNTETMIQYFSHLRSSSGVLLNTAWPMCQQMHNAKDPSTQLPWCSCSQGRCSSQDWWRDHYHCQSPGRAAPGSADLGWVQSYTMLNNCVATDMLHNKVRLTFNEVILGWIIS